MKTLVNSLYSIFILLFIYSFFVPAISYFDIEEGYSEPIIFFGIIPNLIIATMLIFKKLFSQETKVYVFILILIMTGVFALADRLSSSPLYQNILEGYWWWFTSCILIMSLVVAEERLLRIKKADSDIKIHRD